MLVLLGFLFCLALVTAASLFWMARAERKRTGLPGNSRVIYADTGAWKRVEGPLFSRRHGLTGKPDYVLDVKSTIIPVEVKPSRRDSIPRESDLIQLAAYGLLIEETLGKGRRQPAYGLLKYRDAVFQIDFTEDLYSRLIDAMAEMRRTADHAEVNRSHDDPRRCRACGYRTACKQALR